MLPLKTNKIAPIHPKKYMLWIAIGSMIMMFAGLTSAFIVRKAQGRWLTFKLPELFWVSTIIIVISSITMYLAKRAYKKEQYTNYTYLLGATLLLGISFLICQYKAWLQLTSYGVLLNGNPSGSFIYVISGFHFVHVLGGLVMLFIFFIKSLLIKNPLKQLTLYINPERTLAVELLDTYWHFVDILWIYLFVFFILYL